MFSFLTENRCTLVKSIPSHSTNPVCEYEHTTATVAEIFRYFHSFLSEKFKYGGLIKTVKIF